MICPVCKIRWADFPKDKFEIKDNGDIIPLTPDAEKLRKAEFDSNNKRLCDDCINFAFDIFGPCN